MQIALRGLHDDCAFWIYRSAGMAASLHHKTGPDKFKSCPDRAHAGRGLIRNGSSPRLSEAFIAHNAQHDHCLSLRSNGDNENRQLSGLTTEMRTKSQSLSHHVAFKAFPHCSESQIQSSCTDRALQHVAYGWTLQRVPTCCLEHFPHRASQQVALLHRNGLR